MHQHCPAYIHGLVRSYICYVITAKSGNQFSTPNDQEFVDIHYLFVKNDHNRQNSFIVIQTRSSTIVSPLQIGHILIYDINRHEPSL